MAKPKNREVAEITLSDNPKKSFTLERVEGGWSFVTITYQNGKIVDIDRTEPDMKSLAIEKFKIAAFNYWSSIG